MHKMEKRNKYTAQFKLTVINFAEEHVPFLMPLYTGNQNKMGMCYSHVLFSTAYFMQGLVSLRCLNFNGIMI